jgi:ATP-dependent RNA helicase DDX19/DBP5
LIGQSQAGTGKTAAFALAMLKNVDPSNPNCQSICLAPSRELARQIIDNVGDIGKYTSSTYQLVIKDSIARNVRVQAQIVVGTPGSVLELIRRKLMDVSSVKLFVLDEADNMMDQGLGDQSIRVKQALPKTAQLVLISATFADAVRAYATSFAPNANMISLAQEELSVDGIKQFYMDCRNAEHKLEVLSAIYGLLTIGQSIIFVKTKIMADKVYNVMTDNGHSVGTLHGSLDADTRDQVMEDFRAGKFKVLVTTNVLSRGIDILSVTLVINYDLPVYQDGRADPETYLHRIGRTGRFGRTGVSINFVHDEKSFTEMKDIEDHFKRDIVRVPTADYMEVEKILKKAVK